MATPTAGNLHWLMPSRLLEDRLQFGGRATCLPDFQVTPAEDRTVGVVLDIGAQRIDR